MNKLRKYITLTNLRKASPEPNMKAICQKVKIDPLKGKNGKA